MDDKLVKKLVGILYYVLVKLESFIFPTIFVILDCDVNFEVPIISGKPLLVPGRELEWIVERYFSLSETF